MKRFGLSLIASLMVATAATADVQSETKEMQVMAENCLEQKREICVVMASTMVLNSFDSMNYLFANDPEGLTRMATLFEQSTFKSLQTGRPEFRKFIAENAIWTMDFYNERFRARVEDEYSYENVRHFYAAFQLMRAQACDELKNAPCAESALWHVANAQKGEHWPKVIDHFAMDEKLATDLPAKMMADYKGRI